VDGEESGSSEPSPPRRESQGEGIVAMRARAL
jgi:hypothetical protein